jgi:hypothetical protein
MSTSGAFTAKRRELQMDCLSSEDLKEERTEFALANTIGAILALSSEVP